MQLQTLFFQTWTWPALLPLRGLEAELRLASQPTAEGILATAKDADALLVTYAKINADMIREMKKCKIISRFGIGVDNVDIEAATRQGIVATKVPDYCIDEVSWTTPWRCFFLSSAKFHFSSARAHAGRWEMPAVVPDPPLARHGSGPRRFRTDTATRRAAESQVVRHAALWRQIRSCRSR